MTLRHFRSVILLILFCANRTSAQDSIAHIDSTLIKRNLAEADLHVSKAAQLFKKNKPQDAFAQLNIAQSLYRQSANTTGQAITWQSYGDYYSSNYVWKKSESSYLKALKLVQADENDLKGNVAAKLANIYFRQNDYVNASKYFTLAIGEFDKADLSAKSASNYVRLSDIRRLQKKYSDAEFLIMRRALPLFRSVGYVQGRISCFDALGHLYHDQKRYWEAKWYYIQANMQARALADTVAITESLINLGNVKTSIGDYKLALKDFREAAALAKRHKLLKQQRDVSAAYARLYAKTGNKYASDSSFKKSDKLNDSMHGLEQQKVSIANSVKPTAVVQKSKSLPRAMAKVALLKEHPWFLVAVPVVGGTLLIWLLIKNARRKKY